jgi:hypothetical protein
MPLRPYNGESPYSDRLAELEAKRDKVRKLSESLDGEPVPELTPEQRQTDASLEGMDDQSLIELGESLVRVVRYRERRYGR